MYVINILVPYICVPNLLQLPGLLYWSFCLKAVLLRGQLFNDKTITVITSPPVGERSNATSMSVCLCLSAREHIPETTFPIHQIFVHVTYGRGLVLWQRCDTLCTSGVTDVVMLAHNEPEEATRKRRILEVTQQGQHGYDTAADT